MTFRPYRPVYLYIFGSGRRNTGEKPSTLELSIRVWVCGRGRGQREGPTPCISIFSEVDGGTQVKNHDHWSRAHEIAFAFAAGAAGGIHHPGQGQPISSFSCNKTGNDGH